MSFKLRTPLVLITGIMLGAGATMGYTVMAARPAPSLPWQQAALFAEVYERVRRDYIEEVPAERLVEDAVRGMTGGLDQYSTYLSAKEYAEMRMGTSGEYSGIGIEVETQAGNIKVVAAIEGSPAARAGIRAGDVIAAVDGIAIDPDNLGVAIDSLRGPPGSHVQITVRRNGAPAPLSFDLVRRKVHVQSVKSEMLEPGFAYVRINQFSETTADDFAAALQALKQDPHLRGAVLDLRNNPGGVLEAAVEVADQLLDKGVIVTAQGRAADAGFDMRAEPGDALDGAPVVVLVNGGSASAAEIVAGALKDHHRAQLIGQKTFGKGSVQTVVSLEQGGALKLTTARYLTPSGASIHELGIAPDIELKDIADAPAATESQAPLVKRDAEVRIALDALKKSAPTSAPMNR